MEYGRLGKTQLQVSRVGLGTGGDAQLGQKLGMTRSESCKIVHRALELGINFFDTSPAYGDTEAILGSALKEAKLVTPSIICTKIQVNEGEALLKAPEKMVSSVERSLKLLNTDRLDIVLLHGLKPDHYSEAIDRLYPDFVRLKEAGMIRHLGVSEHMWADLDQSTISKAIETDLFDVFMFRYNMCTQGPERRIFPKSSKYDPGLLCMSPVRKPFCNPHDLNEWIHSYKNEGILGPEALSESDPISHWIKEGTSVLADRGIKFVAHQKAIHVIVTGTSNIDHLKANVDSAFSPSLPPPVESALRRINEKIEKSRPAAQRRM